MLFEIAYDSSAIQAGILSFEWSKARLGMWLQVLALFHTQTSTLLSEFTEIIF